MSSKVLFGREAILRYLGINKNAFYKWVDRGMPASKEGQREWVSHQDALDQFFFKRALKKTPNPRP